MYSCFSGYISDKGDNLRNSTRLPVQNDSTYRYYYRYFVIMTSYNAYLHRNKHYIIILSITLLLPLNFYNRHLCPKLLLLGIILYH